MTLNAGSVDRARGGVAGSHTSAGTAVVIAGEVGAVCGREVEPLVAGGFPHPRKRCWVATLVGAALLLCGDEGRIPFSLIRSINLEVTETIPCNAV